MPSALWQVLASHPAPVPRPAALRGGGGRHHVGRHLGHAHAPPPRRHGNWMLPPPSGHAHRSRRGKQSQTEPCSQRDRPTAKAKAQSNGASPRNHPRGSWFANGAGLQMCLGLQEAWTGPATEASRGEPTCVLCHQPRCSPIRGTAFWKENEAAVDHPRSHGISWLQTVSPLLGFVP